MVASAASRFGYIGEKWLDMHYDDLKFWYDLAVLVAESEKNAVSKGKKNG